MPRREARLLILNLSDDQQRFGAASKPPLRKGRCPEGAEGLSIPQSAPFTQGGLGRSHTGTTNVNLEELTMKKKTTVSMSLIIVNCLNAALWIANLVFYLAEQATEPKLLLFKTVCAVLWSITALISIFRYRKEKNTIE